MAKKKLVPALVLTLMVSVLIFAQLLDSPASVYAFQVDSLPSDNLVANPWFRAGNNPNRPGFDHWTNANNYWTLSQKESNPTPDLLISGRCSNTKPVTPTYCGTAAKLAADDGNGQVGVDSYLYQIILADPNNTRLKFFTHWVAHYADPFEVNIYGAESKDGPWTFVWRPVHQQVLSLKKPPSGESQNWLWEHFTSLTPMSEIIIPQGFSYYKLEIHVNLPKPDGFKVTGVYFTVVPEFAVTSTPTTDVSLSPTFTPAITATPTDVFTATPTPTETPLSSPSSTPSADTPTPVITVSPTPTETPLPSPSSTPSGNTSPFITTTLLNSGTTGQSYSSALKGYDDDIGDILVMTGENLPPGLSIANCSTRSGNGVEKIVCYLTGTPTAAGLYTATITLSDDKGGSSSKVFDINIK